VAYRLHVVELSERKASMCHHVFEKPAFPKNDPIKKRRYLYNKANGHTQIFSHINLLNLSYSYT